MSEPLVSVVLSVYNDETYLPAALESILTQEGVDFEVVAVDDGSTDMSPEILASFARADARVRVVRQENAGLTRALVRGCAEAKGELIARQDADDLSRPGRLATLASVLTEEPKVAVVASWIELIGPRDEPLMTTRFPTGLEAGTRAVLEERRSPIHGSAVFRKRDLEAVGGYRPEFYFAQDSDLWFRLADRGAFLFLPEPLYAFRVQGGSITARHRPRQLELYEIALSCRAARLAGEPEAPLLEAAARIRPAPKGDAIASVDDAASYFLGCALLARRDPRAIGYLVSHVRRKPLDPKGWIRLAQAIVRVKRSARNDGGQATA